MNGLIVILPIAALLIGSTGTWLVGFSGYLNVRVNKKKNEDTASTILVHQAMELVDQLSKQVKELRADNASLEEHQMKENQVLRERVRVLEARVSELELENARLKAQLYDRGQ